MMALSFSAQCARGHDRIEFTDRAEFERHMTGAHKARKLSPTTSLPQRHGGLPASYLRPSRAPKDTRKLSAVLAKAASEVVAHGRPMGSVFAVTDWHTDDLVELAEVRTGDVFVLGRHEYLVHDREAWLVTGPGATEPTRPRNIEARLGDVVRIVKRAA